MIKETKHWQKAVMEENWEEHWYSSQRYILLLPPNTYNFWNQTGARPPVIEYLSFPFQSTSSRGTQVITIRQHEGASDLSRIALEEKKANKAVNVLKRWLDKTKCLTLCFHSSGITSFVNELCTVKQGGLLWRINTIRALSWISFLIVGDTVLARCNLEMGKRTGAQAENLQSSDAYLRFSKSLWAAL